MRNSSLASFKSLKKITIIFIFAAGIASAGVLECIEDSDCIASDASCVDSLCECPKGKIFRADYSACSECK